VAISFLPSLCIIEKRPENVKKPVVSFGDFYYSQGIWRTFFPGEHHMRKIITSICLLQMVFFLWGSEMTSLSQIFQLNHGIEDRDGDGYADHIALFLVVPENSGSHFTAAAEEIAARANLESLSGYFDMITHDTSPVREGIPVYLLTGKDQIQGYPALGPHQGRIFLSRTGGPRITVAGGSPEAMLKAARAFFLRWPYLWDIWGREEGDTYHSLEHDATEFIKNLGSKIRLESVAVISSLYEFYPEKTLPPALKKLRFPEGELIELEVSIRMKTSADQQQTEKALNDLRRQHRQGQNTNILSYSGCAGITFILGGPEPGTQVHLPRTGSPAGRLTPGYEPVSPPKYPEQSFDLTDWLSIRGILSDTNQDNIPDDISTTIVIPAGSAVLNGLPSRLLLHSAGASFPLVKLDSEIDDPAGLRTPILVGKNNALIKKLKKAGKLADVSLSSPQASAQIVPAAFNKTAALILTSGDDASLSALTRYFSRTYPYLQSYEKGSPRLEDVQKSWQDFLVGKNGAAEAFVSLRLQEEIDKFQGLELDTLKVRLDLPEKNPDFVRHIREKLESGLKARSMDIECFSLDEGRTVFKKNKKIPWEGAEALRMIEEQLETAAASPHPVSIELGVSESAPVRRRLRQEIQTRLEEAGVSVGAIQIGCSYKPGFFWLRESILPLLQQHDVDRITIKCAETDPEFNRPKRFYPDPNRWLYELYPIDDIIARETTISMERIVFETVNAKNPIYQVEALDAEGQVLFKESFTPPTHQITYMPLLPEWGETTVTTGWIKISQNQRILMEKRLPSDLERFWEFYQRDVLTDVYQYIHKKTGENPTFSKQPYFKQLKIDLYLSEPDFSLGLDQERISSLEAVHDEIYFDTLDFLRGITEKDPNDEDKKDEIRRASAPGLVLPVIHPSLEGNGSGQAEVLFEENPSSTARIRLDWEDTEGRTSHRSHSFPSLKTEFVKIPRLTFDSQMASIDTLFLATGLTREKDYLFLIDLISEYDQLEEKDLIPPAFAFSGLKQTAVGIEFDNLKKEMIFISKPEEDRFKPAAEAAETVPLDEIISPEQALRITRFLGEKPGIRTYIAGYSYQGRDIPVLEIFSPIQNYVSLPRLVTLKPTLLCSGRQHANEISATNYILEFARRLVEDETYSGYAKQINFVFHPMENPDGAAAAYELQKLTPEHSLHAGRYSSLGIDVGSQVYADDPLLPEAEVRNNLMNRWKPDIYLNLHGYPSHEWVQPFSGYVPFLFRDYWIPKGWFVYYRALSLPLFPDFRQAGLDLKKFIIDRLNGNPKIRESNQRLYDRYHRWAARWQPHLSRLEIQDGVNIYSKRRSSRESWLTPRREMTYVEETPEVMDETATGEWLHFLVQQGLVYLQAHAEYLSQSQFERVRVEEEVNDRIRIRFFRRRPGKIRNPRQ
jgi:hypothetical protein